MGEAGQSTEVAIVGGGMVGVSLALMLAQQADCRITLLEAFSLGEAGERPFQSSFDARSTALSAGSRRLLEKAGLWGALSEHITAIRRVHVSDRGHFGGSVIRAEEHGLEAVGYVVENAWLGQVLGRALRAEPRISGMAPAVVRRAEARASGYRLSVEQGADRRLLDCALLVLADGMDSRLRQQLGVELHSRDYGQSAVIANVSCDRPHQGIAYERFTSDGPIALLPLGESDDSHTMALVWTRPAPQAPELLEAGDATFLARLQREFGYRQGRFTAVSRRHLYQLKLSVAREQHRRGLLLMGNVAHSLHPVAGQGFNLALRDCAALSEALGAGRRGGTELSDPCLLEDYLRRQGADQFTTIQLSDSFVRWFSSGHVGRSVLRNLGLFALDALPPVKHLLGRQTMGLM